MRITAIFLALLVVSERQATAAEIIVHDPASSPESMAVGPDGALYVGSASSPSIYRIRKGGKAERFVDASAEGPGAYYLGQFVDRASNTLWACQLVPIAGGSNRHSSVRGFDLDTGKEKQRWDLPGDNSTCNDMAIGADGALFITDTANATIYRMRGGAKSADLFIQHRSLAGVDGITFLDGALYVNSVSVNNLYRIPIDAEGKAGIPVDIWMDAPVRAPDGMRASNGKLFMIENGAGKIDVLTIRGDTAHVTVLKEGLKTPTGVEPAGDTLWYTERGAGKIWSMPMPH